MTWRHVIGGEIAKAKTLRPLRSAVLVAIVLTIAYCVADAMTSGSGERAVTIPATAAGVYGMANLSFFAIIVAVLVTASEYAGGQITTTMLATPRRGQLFAAKLLVSTAIVTVLAVFVATCIAVFYQAAFGQESVFVVGGVGTLLAALARGIGFWVLLGVIASCLAVVVRSQTVVLSAMIVATFGGIPLMMTATIFQYLPTNAGQLMFIGDDQTGDWLNPPTLGVTGAVITTMAWCVVALIVATAVLHRRDVGARQGIVE